MEAEVISSSLGAMVSLRSKLQSLVASPEHQRPNPLKDEVEHLQQDLEEINTFLVNLSRSETPNRMANHWMNEVRDLSYDMEDYIDCRVQPMERANGRMKKEILHIVKDFRTLLKQARERHERYELGRWASDPSCMVNGQDSVVTLERKATHLVGRRGSTDQLIEWLKPFNNARQLKVVAIHGSTGVGKSSIANEVCRKIGGQFQCLAFVRASRMPDTRRLLWNIISQVQCHQRPAYGSSVQDLIDNLRKHLQEKRYFIVVDELWETTSWDIIRSAFPEGTHCSRILVTTDIEEVALQCCNYQSNVSEPKSKMNLKVKPLDTRDSTDLFFTKVFGSNHELSQKFSNDSEEIIRKCGGLPLAIVSIGNIFASQPDNSELWRYVKEYLSSNMRNNLASEDMLREIVGLNYNSLSHHLKTCLLYFSMYPEGYTFLKADLVKQWTAEGFISAIEGKDMNEIAECYFDELVCRGFIRPNSINFSDKVIFYTVHSTVFELIGYKSVEKNFTTAVDYSETIIKLSTKVRRLSLSFSNAKYATKPKDITLSPVRSLNFYGPVECMPSITEFKLLRVLILEFWADKKNTNLSGIYRLFQLRYVRVTTDDTIVRLPAKMRGLKYLETLEVYGRIRSVPSDIVHLPKLLHLRLQGEIKRPACVGQMKSLRSLQYFDLSRNSEDNVQSLGEMTSLYDLHITCSTEMTDSLKKSLIALAYSLGKLGNLKSLILAPNASSRSSYFDCLSSVSSPPDSLNRLELLPPICIVSRLPEWIGQLQKLCILKVSIKVLKKDDLNRIAGLPELSVLSLYVRQPTAERIIFSSAEFPVLKYFKLKCGIMCLDFQSKTMPNLRSLNLAFNAHRGGQYRDMITSLENLVNLQEMVVRIGAAPGSDESERVAAETVFNDAAIKWRLKPLSFSVERTDSVEEENPEFFGSEPTSYCSGYMLNRPVMADVIGEANEIDIVQDNELRATSSQAKQTDEPGVTSTFHRQTPPEASEWSKRYGESVSGTTGSEDLVVGLAKTVVEGVLSKVQTAIKEMKLQQSVQRNLMFIADEFEMMNSFLNVTNENHVKNNFMKTWARQVCDLAYDAEDCIEFFIHFDNNPSSRRCMLPACLGQASIVGDIKLLRARVEDVSQRNVRYNMMINHSGSKPNMQQLTAPNAAIGTIALDMQVEMTEKKQKGLRDIITQLLTKKQGDLGVISVWGTHSELGTTSIIRKAYDDPELCQNFECRGWVKLQHPFNSHEFLRSLVVQLYTNSSLQDGTDVNVDELKNNEVMTTIQGTISEVYMEKVNKKRYLVVIENVSTMTEWDTIRTYFPDRKNGSLIIVSTEKHEIARLCIGHSYQVLELEQYSAEGSISIFFKELMSDSGSPNPVMEMKKLAAARSSSFDMLAEERSTTRKQRDMDALTKLVTRRGSDRQVISVWESGGDLGALSMSSISKAYDNAKHWGCRAWIKLGNPFNLHEFRRSLIDQFCGNGVQGRNQAPKTEDYLIHEQVNNRRYLVVLENLSTNKDWDAILGSLPDRSNGSRIVVLTQQFQVARYCTGLPCIQYFWASNSVCVFFKEGSLIGRISDINQLSGYLAKARMEALQVISVWGIPGVGKSALVRNLFHNTELPHHKFEKHGWVDVSHPFDLRYFSRGLLLQLVYSHPLELEANDEASRDPVEECRDLLRRHKCLVVIDDLQSIEEWKMIQAALVSRTSESVIIVITNEDNIAIKCADRKDLVFNVKPLGVGAAIDLLKTKASPYFSVADIEKDSVLQKLISKCSGLPKVILAIADILAQDFNWTEKASILNGSFVHNLETSPEFSCLDGLFSWMHFYLGALPRHIRKHVAYLLIFPEDSSIRRRRLVMRWGAEGYSTDTENHTADENGEELFSRLVKQTMMIQPPPLTTTTDMRMVSFEVNAIFREYMISRPLKENIATAIELFVLRGACSPTSTRTGRHLVIEQSWDRDMIVFQNIDFSRLRSLTVFGEWKPFFISENMKVLRVLDLEDASGVTNKDLQYMIKLLPRLKFLSLRGCHEISSLPSSVGELRQLQILDVTHTNIVTIPASITKLKKLQYIRAVPAPSEFSSASRTVAFKSWKFHRHLQLVGVQVMSGIAKLTALHTLGVVNVSNAGGKVFLKELRNLTQVRKLGVSGVSKKNGKEFCSAILCHFHLESLSVWLNKDNQDCLDGMVHRNINETAGPANRLQSLKLYGPIEKLPIWTEQLNNLRKLNLEISTLSEAETKVLGGLQELRILRLCVNPHQDRNLRFYVEKAGVEDRSYKMIKVLEIGSRSNLHLTFGSLAMKNLELLTAGSCINGSQLRFDGLKHLSKLKDVRVIGSNDESLKKNLMDQFADHTSKPALKLEEVITSTHALTGRNDQHYYSFPFYCTTR